VFHDGSGSGAVATAVLAPHASGSPSSVASITVSSGGSGYVSSPAKHAVIATTAKNVLNQSVTTVSDCFTGATLSVKDANQALACSQYDGLGRVVETAAPGDLLSAQAQCSSASDVTACYVRDTGNCATSGTAIGNGGEGPTTWTEYFPYGCTDPPCRLGGNTTYNEVRTISHSRDGTTDGLVHVAFVDGEGRSTASCAEMVLDPAQSATPGASCTTTVYDSMGRPSLTYTPFYVSTMPTTAPTAPTSDQYTQTGYDGIGRVVSTQLLKNGASVGIPAATTRYSGSGSLWITTVTDPDGCEAQSKTDCLGRAVEHDVQANACGAAPSWYATTMAFDSAGRLLNITDPASNVTSFQYDGLSRKTQMTDPDMGTWKYAYDDNGKLTKQTDARGAVINMSYDALNRLTLKEIPYLKNGTTWTNNMGEEDVVSYYDAAPSPACHTSACPLGSYCCDDHCSTTTDSCVAATLTCAHTGTKCANPDQ
jgi:YD repeat-containing protein